MENLGPIEELSDEHEEDFIPLRPGLVMNQQIEVLPVAAWEKVKHWYGLKPGTHEIRRYAHNTVPDGARDEQVQYELYPPVFTIRKLRNEASSSATREEDIKAPRLLASRASHFQKFLRDAKARANIDMRTKVKMWRIIENIPTSVAGQDVVRTGMLTPQSSRSGSPTTANRPKLLMDMDTFTSMAEGSQREMIDVKDETNNPNYNGRLKMDIVGLSQDQVLILEEQMTGPGGGEFVSDNLRVSASKNNASVSAGKGVLSKIKGTDSRSSSPNPSTTAPITRGRTRRDGRTKGSVGLSNLGNTCYMNSALQCIRSVEELTIYFISGKYKEELNESNPLGHNGAIAKAYAGLLESVYADTNTLSFAPRNFKNVLGRHAPTFSGYGQQDSQEFLSFLVDGIHEDLNRIHKKPYVENPESDDKTVGDEKAIKELGNKFRENHHARNDSVAMDLFNGFYKNTMVCPVCDKVSITFDPYSLLTLQLPIEQTWQHTIVFQPLHGRPFQIQIDIDKNSSIRSLKEYVAKRVPDTNANNLILAEVYTHKFYKVFDDNSVIAEQNIQSRDELIMYEMETSPSNWPAKKKPKKNNYSMLSFDRSEDEVPEMDSAAADRMLIPIFHRVLSATSYSASRRQLTLWPSFIVVTREEAKNLEEIQRKVLANVAQTTTHNIFEHVDVRDDYQNSSDTVVTTEEDASSNADPTVTAKSVESDEGLVDVRMEEAPIDNDEPDHKGYDSDAIRYRHPALIPGAPTGIRLGELFTMKYSKSNGTEMIQTGWSQIQANNDYPTLESREPKVPDTPESRRSSVSDATDASVNTNSSGQSDHAQFSNLGDMNAFEADSETDADELAPMTQMRDVRARNFQKHGKGKRGRRKGPVTYGNKGRINRREQSESSAESGDENPYLIRLGEAIICDWEHDPYETCFGAQDANDNLRGVDTWSVMETLEDPELAMKKEQRAKRKREGVSLQDCFAETAKEEILSEENTWYCNRCKEQRRAYKKLEIWTVPDILVIHLKRFSAHRAFRDKIDVLVDFPVEGLDIKDWVGMPDGKETIYDLFAVDNHYGGLGGGHYTAIAQNFYDKKWYDYNGKSLYLSISCAILILFVQTLKYRNVTLNLRYLLPLIYSSIGDGQLMDLRLDLRNSRKS
jgi:ubiquitin carboxyl-terminal hydrolase 4/11